MSGLRGRKTLAIQKNKKGDRNLPKIYYLCVLKSRLKFTIDFKIEMGVNNWI